MKEERSQKSGVRSQNRHTPGPWFAYGTTVCNIKPEKTSCGWTWKKGENPKTICHTDDFDIPENQHKANAKLIAAAPEMINVLKRILMTEELSIAGQNDIKSIIKKATGGK